MVDLVSDAKACRNFSHWNKNENGVTYAELAQSDTGDFDILKENLVYFVGDFIEATE